MYKHRTTVSMPEIRTVYDLNHVIEYYSITAAKECNYIPGEEKHFQFLV
jgi:hypothetical protein